MEDEIKELLLGIDKNKDIEVKTSDEFRQYLASFIVQQTKKVQEQDIALKIITDEFLSKVRTHDVEISDLLSWYKVIQSSKSDYARTLLDIFRPTGQITSPLLSPKENDREDDISEKMSHVDMVALQKFIQVFDKFQEKFEHREDQKI